MTRLKPADIGALGANLERYDRELRCRTGHGLRGIACRAMGVCETRLTRQAASLKVAVVPMTCGLGTIAHFADSLQHIAAHLGFQAATTPCTDAAGLAQAFESQSDICLLSDDERFVALNLKTRRVVDNAVATARGFVAGLDLMAGGVAGRSVLVIGCGPVGSHAARELVKLDARVDLFDIVPQRARDLQKELEKAGRHPAAVAQNWHQDRMEHRLFVDASTARGLFGPQDITPETFIAAPGMPCGIETAARVKIESRCLHDPLQLGVATMLVAAAQA